jgi:hypothetical protein
MGKGSKNVFLLGREHGHEPVGTCGLTALIEGLVEGRIPGSDHKFPLAEKLLKRFKFHIFPLMNPDAAERFSRQVRDSLPALQFRYSKEDSERYRTIHSEPGVMLGKGRPPHFTNEDLEAWRKTGKPIGSLYTEDGVELWMDWKYEKAPQTRALKKLMHAMKPSLFVDIHAWETETALLMPAQMDDESLNLHRTLGSLLYNRLEEASIPFNPRKEVQPTGDSSTSIGWAYQTFHRASYYYLFEVDNGYRWYDPNLKAEDVRLPTISKDQIILSVWYGITALLEGMMKGQ